MDSPGVVTINIVQAGRDWRVNCAACPTYIQFQQIEDDALYGAWSHHQIAHPRDVMAFQRS